MIRGFWVEISYPHTVKLLLVSILLYVRFGKETDRWQFRNHHHQRSQKVDHEIRQVVVRVVCANQEQQNRYHQQKLLCRCVLVTTVDLLPHVQIVVGSCVELERHTPDPVEHDERSDHVENVDERPRSLLCDVGDNVEDDFEKGDQHEVNDPSTCKYLVNFLAHPTSISLSVPFAFTHSELRFGKTAWSLMCSRVSGGS